MIGNLISPIVFEVKRGFTNVFSLIVFQVK
jgi:hypothetical protein